MLNKIDLRTDPCSTPLSNTDHKLKLVFVFCSLQKITKVTLLCVRNSYQYHVHLNLLKVTHYLSTLIYLSKLRHTKSLINS